MKNETRRRIANWLLKIPGFIEAFDIHENEKIAHVVAKMTAAKIAMVPDRYVPVIGKLPDWFPSSMTPDEWAKNEAMIVVSRLKELKSAKVRFEGEEIVISFQKNDATSAPSQEEKK